jgi:hypothetical protein
MSRVASPQVAEGEFVLMGVFFLKEIFFFVLKSIMALSNYSGVRSQESGVRSQNEKTSENI